MIHSFHDLELIRFSFYYLSYIIFSHLTSILYHIQITAFSLRERMQKKQEACSPIWSSWAQNIDLSSCCIWYLVTNNKKKVFGFISILTLWLCLPSGSKLPNIFSTQNLKRSTEDAKQVLDIPKTFVQSSMWGNVWEVSLSILCSFDLLKMKLYKAIDHRLTMFCKLCFNLCKDRDFCKDLWSFSLWY